MISFQNLPKYVFRKQSTKGDTNRFKIQLVPVASVYELEAEFFWVKLRKREKEEISSDPFAGDACGLANAGTRAVPHCAVTLHLADAGTGTVAYRAILIKLTDARTGTVADGAILINLADAGTGAVADSAIAIESADTRSTGIADGAVTLNLATA